MLPITYQTSMCFQFFNTLRLRQDGRYFCRRHLQMHFLNENVGFSLKISLMFVPEVRIHNILALVRIMACCLVATKPLSKPMMVSLLTHICITRPQWVKGWINLYFFPSFAPLNKLIYIYMYIYIYIRFHIQAIPMNLWKNKIRNLVYIIS